MVVTDSAAQSKKIAVGFSATQKIASDFARRLKGGEVLALFGDLGSGKTTFIQGLAKGLGIKKRVISPTFVLVRQYPIPKPYPLNPIPLIFYHVDLYRLGKIREIENLGLGEIFTDKNAITAIEWADRLEKHLPKGAIKIYFENIGGNQRKIRFVNLRTVNYEL